MNRLARTGLAVAMAAGTYVGFHAFFDGLLPQPEEFNPKVEACATAYLGEVAIESTAKPDGECKDFEFPYRRTEVYEFEPVGRDRTDIKDETVYLLPTADDFLNQHILRQEEADRMDTAIDWVILGTTGFVAIAGYRMFAPLKQKQPAQTPTDTISA